MLLSQKIGGFLRCRVELSFQIVFVQSRHFRVFLNFALQSFNLARVLASQSLDDLGVLTGLGFLPELLLADQDFRLVQLEGQAFELGRELVVLRLQILAVLAGLIEARIHAV